MTRATLLNLLLPFLISGSAPAQPAGPSLNTELTEARAEQAAAEARVAQLQRAASQARGEAERLRAEQVVAAQEIEASEARITAADAQLRLADAYVIAHRQHLAEQQRPVSSLLAGLAVMARRPPLLALADGGGTDELVKVRVLLDSTLPAIRARTGRIAAELDQGERLRDEAAAARRELILGRQDLVTKRQKFALVEQKTLERSLAAGREALTAGDVALSAGEEVDRLRGAQLASSASASLVRQLLADGPAPPRPLAPQGPFASLPFAYELPAAAPISEGFADVSTSGVRSRGLTLDTPRGAAVAAPASGTVRFAGPFRDYDGVLLIDHGGGWMSLIVNVATPLRSGARLAIGQPVGRALGPLLVELSQNGRRISPALIAGSSQTLSKGRKGG